MKRMIQMLKKHEGLELFPYTDPISMKLHIGYGQNIEDRGISTDVAEYMLVKEVEICRKQVLENLPVGAHIGPARFDVLTMLRFNLGLSGLMSFKRMWVAIVNDDFILAAQEMLDSKAARQLPRRYKEYAEIMKFGAYKFENRQID